MSSRAQIVATIGPASASLDVLESMVRAGMDVARLNFSHNTHESHKELIGNIRNVATRVGKKVLIIADLSGPRVETRGEQGHGFDPNHNAKSVITDKDKKDLEFVLKEGVDYVAMSYVGRAADVTELRDIMRRFERVVPIIAKIERGEAMKNLDSIIEISDALMVARGDLGIALPIETMPFLEREIIEKSKVAGKPVIVATEMLESMIEHPEPTRAEVTDIAYAIILGADAVMLSAESATGKYPVKAVEVMERVVAEAERHLNQTNYNPL